MNSSVYACGIPRVGGLDNGRPKNRGVIPIWTRVIWAGPLLALALWIGGLPEAAWAKEGTAGAGLSAAMDRLGWRLVSSRLQNQEEGTSQGDGNVLLSPWGLVCVMTVLDLGTRGDTKGAVTAAWTGRPEATSAVLDSLATLRASLIQARPPTRAKGEPSEGGAENGTGAPGTGPFTDANGLWIAAPSTVSASVAQQAEATLGVQVASVDFGDPVVLAELNAWAAARTNGAIPVLLDRPDPNLRAVAANGMHYTAPWVHPFPKAQSHAGTFFTETGAPLDVTVMRGVMPDVTVAHTARFDRVALPLAGGKTVLRLTLPTTGHGLADVLPNVLDDQPLGSASTPAGDDTERMVGQWVDLTLPRFTITAGGDLTEALGAVGLGLLFNGRADFSGLAPGLTHFDALTQRVRLAVDEAGLEAAAMTVASSTRSLPREPDLSLVFDRPFLVDLIHVSSGVVLLTGAVFRPTEATSTPPE